MLRGLRERVILGLIFLERFVRFALEEVSMQRLIGSYDFTERGELC